MAAGFELGSFEYPLSLSIPGKLLARCYFVALEKENRCDQLLSDLGGKLIFVSESQLESLGFTGKVIDRHYLGYNSEQQFWVAVVAEQELPTELTWQGLRSQLTVLEPWLFSLAGRALQIAQWFLDHAYCGRCGHKTELDDLDRAKLCPVCGLRFYPRIAPCMIVLVTRDDQLLLAHHARSTKPVYTTLAGFVEAGESVEETVRREVMEEVGVSLGKVTYFDSQSWPFPGQLMLGFFAEYESGEIDIDPKEILDARWFRYDQLPYVPPVATIAGRLIAHFVQECTKKHQN